MADAIVRARALRWVSDDQPGFIEVGIMDGDGREHRIIEKVPVLTTGNLTSATALPAELWIRADTSIIEGERVQVTFAYSVETTEGLTGVSVSASDVKWL
ncbi:MAG TPA: hypothetical protein VFZ32_14295 [Micromonosporaceae bacterium]